jgi:kynurenine formamidase
MNDPTGFSKLYSNAPSNWSRWGKDDEVGSLNFLNESEVLRAVKSVKSGKVFPLMLKLRDPAGSPNWPGRAPASHFMCQDKGAYENGKLEALHGGLCYADDVVMMNTHGTTHCDGLGHTFCENKMYNGYSAETTKGGMEKCGILPIAEKGIVARGVFLDVPKYKGKDRLDMHEQITLEDLLKTAEKQGAAIEKHDALVIRTGIFKLFYEKGAEAFYSDFNEPGLTYEKKLIEFLHEMEIPIIAIDNLGGEMLRSPTTEYLLPIHVAASQRLGIVLNEALWLEELAKDCEKDGNYSGMYMASPLKIVGGTASPINPLWVK